MADKPTMQDVLERFYSRYLEKHTPSAQQIKAAVHILKCKTGAYGMNISRCGQCGYIRIHNNSCRDRSCPICQALSNELWVDAQNEHVLDIDYVLYLEIGYHPEKKLGSPGKPISHYHVYNPLFSKTTVGWKELRSDAIKLPGGMKKKLRKYFKGVKL